MTYTKEQFLSDVKAEAVALRQHATKEELGRLSFNTLCPDAKSHCVYGLMTGHCSSARALELIKKCCTRYFHESLDNVIGSFDSVQSRVNGETCDLSKRGLISMAYFSSIEVYILTRDAQNANLISYLRGETDDLNL